MEHFKSIKADHVPAGIVKTLNLASSKVNKSGKAPMKTVKVPVADGKTRSSSLTCTNDDKLITFFILSGCNGNW